MMSQGRRMIMAAAMLGLCLAFVQSCSCTDGNSSADRTAKVPKTIDPELKPLVGKQVVLIGKAVSHQEEFAWIEIDKSTLVQVSNENKWSKEFEGRQVKVSGTLEVLHIPSVPPEDTWPLYYIENAKWELTPVTRSSR
jgi:hypothetical protein